MSDVHGAAVRGREKCLDALRKPLHSEAIEKIIHDAIEEHLRQQGYDELTKLLREYLLEYGNPVPDVVLRMNYRKRLEQALANVKGGGDG